MRPKRVLSVDPDLVYYIPITYTSRSCKRVEQNCMYICVLLVAVNVFVNIIVTPRVHVLQASFRSIFSLI